MDDGNKNYDYPTLQFYTSFSQVLISALIFATNSFLCIFCQVALGSELCLRWLKLILLLRSEIPSGICAKLRTVAASNNRVHMPWSLYYCLFTPYICMVLFFTNIPFVVNHTINATPPEMLQHYMHQCWVVTPEKWEVTGSMARGDFEKDCVRRWTVVSIISFFLIYIYERAIFSL